MVSFIKSFRALALEGGGTGGTFTFYMSVHSVKSRIFGEMTGLVTMVTPEVEHLVVSVHWREQLRTRK